MSKAKPEETGRKIICTNRKARHEYFILETLEAGIKLQGTEVKSVRGNRVTLDGSFVSLKQGQVMLIGCNIEPYEMGSYNNHEGKRDRLLLLNKREIRNFVGKAKEKGLTLIPLVMYFKRGLVKVEIALARGKQLHDKRQSLKEKDVKRELRQ